MKPLIFAAALTLLGAVLAAPSLGRCYMGECLFCDQASRHIGGKGRPAVPGDLVLISLRSAVTNRPNADPTMLDWGAPAPVQVFCSTHRPAFRMGDGSYQGLDLVTPAGATTLVSAMYLRGRHPNAKLAEDPFAAAAALGYDPTPTDVYSGIHDLTRG